MTAEREGLRLYHSLLLAAGAIAKIVKLVDVQVPSLGVFAYFARKMAQNWRKTKRLKTLCMYDFCYKI